MLINLKKYYVIAYIKTSQICDNRGSSIKLHRVVQNKGAMSVEAVTLQCTTWLYPDDVTKKMYTVGGLPRVTFKGGVKHQ